MLSLEDLFMAQGRKTTVRILLSDEERMALESWQRSTTLRTGLVRRAQIILLVAEGLSIAEVVRKVGITRHSVYKWVGRFQQARMDGLEDKPGRGRKPFFSARRGGPCNKTGMRAA
jgi:DNA invertase Pin-like site-specific DNA recombinase